MSKNDAPGLIPLPPHSPQDRRVQLLAQIAAELATGATTVEELGSRLRDDVGVPPTVNLTRPVQTSLDHDEAIHAHVDVTAPHGGIIPGP